MDHRLDRVNTLLQQELAGAIRETIEFPRGVLVTVSSVDTSRDLGHARIWISVLPFEGRFSVIKHLERKRGALQSILAHTMPLRRIPKLIFTLDERGERASAIESILDSIKEET